MEDLNGMKYDIRVKNIKKKCNLTMFIFLNHFN